MSSKISDYISLAKPGLTFVSVATAVGGAFLATREGDPLGVLWQTFVGTFVAGGGAGALNQYMEREFDARMTRTGLRPLPANKLPSRNVLLFGIFLCLSGTAYLALFTTPVAALLTTATLLIYLFLYTPMKRRTPFATVVGGVAGAIPPLIGWSAATGGISVAGSSLFFILFFWQTPHFLALGWMHRKDYERAGYKVLTVADPTGAAAGRQALIYCVALIPASLMPSLTGLAGPLYSGGAIACSLAYLVFGLNFFRMRTDRSARLLFTSSIVYIPLLFILLILDRLFH